MRSLTVTLPDEMVEEIEAKVATSEYASACDLVRDGVETLVDFGFALDERQIAEIRASFDEMEADPSLGIPADEIMDHVRRGPLGTDG